ncbi:MAG: hypothetical protein LPK18_11185 [Pseudomonadaceae bacterium]|nr:hypothetical protein [Pseudomonadaceae bacterium]
MKSMPQGQRGVVLVVGLVMLLLVTLLVVNAFSLSSSSLDSVSNQQWRSEAVYAADAALEQVIGSAFVTAPQAQVIPVDINQDSTAEYQVAVTEPVCERASLASATAPSSVTLAGISNSTWNTVFGMQATVDDDVTGAAVTVRSGVRVLLSEAQKNLLCP